MKHLASDANSEFLSQASLPEECEISEIMQNDFCFNMHF